MLTELWRRIASQNLQRPFLSVSTWVTQCSLIRATEKRVRHAFIEEIFLELCEQNFLQLYFSLPHARRQAAEDSSRGPSSNCFQSQLSFPYIASSSGNLNRRHVSHGRIAFITSRWHRLRAVSCTNIAGFDKICPEVGFTGELIDTQNNPQSFAGKTKHILVQSRGEEDLPCEIVNALGLHKLCLYVA